MTKRKGTLWLLILVVESCDSGHAYGCLAKEACWNPSVFKICLIGKDYGIVHILDKQFRLASVLT